MISAQKCNDMSPHSPFSLRAFAAHLGTRFLTSDAGPALALELIDAEPLDHQAPHDNRFSLMLRGPSQPLLPQATYVFEHAALGTLAIFIVPVGRTEAGTAYQAIFN